MAKEINLTERAATRVHCETKRKIKAIAKRNGIREGKQVRIALEQFVKENY